MQGSLPAGGLAFTGRELNPLDRYKRFQITHPPLLDLSWRKKGPPSSLVQLRAAVWTGVTRVTRPRADMRRVAIPQRSEPPDLIVTDALCCQILSGQREHIQLGQLKRREFTKL